MTTLAELAKANVTAKQNTDAEKDAAHKAQWAKDNKIALNAFKKKIGEEVIRLSRLGYGGYKVAHDMIQAEPWGIRESCKKWLTAQGIKLELIDKSYMDRDSYGPLDWVERKWTRLTWGDKGTVLNDDMDKPREWDD